MEYRILGFGIQISAQGIRNSTNDWYSESSSTESEIQFVESIIQNHLEWLPVVSIQSCIGTSLFIQGVNSSTYLA